MIVLERELSSFLCLGCSSECKNVYLKIPLLDKVFEIHAAGRTLGSLMPLAIMERAVILRTGTGWTVLLWLMTLHPRLTLDSFEDVLDRELQWSEVVIRSVSSE